MEELTARDHLALLGHLGVWVAVILSPALIACGTVLAIAALTHGAGPSTGASTAPKTSPAVSRPWPVAAAAKR